MTAPAPSNLTAMSEAWDDPVAFARELHHYYSQLEASGHRLPAHDWTTAAHAAETDN
ncbi:hypothetical protein [Microbacterium soli]|uniref:Uncharacterized protein n=1 Tax=Microbacterium soli TaxID=446075 RepID=A0ABP7NBD8_9MICO